jgi:hypothetical protein
MTGQKKLVVDKQSSLFCRSFSDVEKKPFYTIDTQELEKQRQASRRRRIQTRRKCSDNLWSLGPCSHNALVSL